MANAMAQALYIELRTPSRVSQMVITPPMHNPATESTLPLRLLGRELTRSSPRRNWQLHVATLNNYDAQRSASPAPSLPAMEATLPLVDEVADHMSGYRHGGWTMPLPPVVVDISYDDFLDLNNRKTPNALIRRVLRARTKAGYPEDLFEAPTLKEEVVVPHVNIARNPNGSFQFTSGPQAGHIAVTAPPPSTSVPKTLEEIRNYVKFGTPPGL